MATLVLSVVGTVVGGPIGGAIGTVVGQMIDRRIFAPPGIKGPQLGDLSVQTSSYGAVLPRVYGTMRVAGTVIWATDLTSHSQTTGGGKSGGSVTTYSYTASLAVALSSRPGMSIGRIWADGRLLRGQRAFLRRQAIVRFYPGDEKQAVDPLIAAKEGAGKATAFRGLCYVVLENLILTDYGNRIPQLSFELIADDDPVPLPAMLEDMSDGFIEPAGDEPRISGFAAHGASRRDAVETLARLYDLPLRDQGRRLLAGAAGSAVDLPGRDRRGCTADSKADQQTEVRRIASASELPSICTLAYYEPDRDFQAGSARATIDGGRGECREDAAVVLTAADAKRLAQQALTSRWARRERWSVALSPEWMSLVPGQIARFADGEGMWETESVTIDGLAVNATFRRALAETVAVRADGGRALPPADPEIGRNRLLLADLPSLNGEQGDRPRLWLAASSDHWQAAPVSGWMNGIETGQMTVRQAARIGTVEGRLADGVPAWLRDERSSIVVQMLGADDWLVSADETTLAMGGNLALIGGQELVQFARVEALGSGRFRVWSFLRGRFGTEWAVGQHSVGESFSLVEPERWVSLPVERSSIGATIEVQSSGLGDDPDDPPSASIVVSGEAMRPPAPVLVRAERLGDGGLVLQWRCRSRRAWTWIDGITAPGDGGTVEIDCGDGRVFSADAQSGEIHLTALEIGDLSDVASVQLTHITADGRSRPWRQLLDQ